MVWTPRHASADVRKILDNLLTFFETNQTEALAWARVDTSQNLEDFQTFYRTSQSRAEKDFPHFGVVRRRTDTDDADDGLRVEYRLTFEIEVDTSFTESDKAAALKQLQIDTDCYVYAVESMFLNIPNATLFEGVGGVGHGYRSITSQDPLEAAAGSTKAMFQVQMNALLKFVENP